MAITPVFPPRTPADSHITAASRRSRSASRCCGQARNGAGVSADEPWGVLHEAGGAFRRRVGRFNVEGRRRTNDALIVRIRRVRPNTDPRGGEGLHPTLRRGDARQPRADVNDRSRPARTVANGSPADDGNSRRARFQDEADRDRLRPMLGRVAVSAFRRQSITASTGRLRRKPRRAEVGRARPYTCRSSTTGLPVLRRDTRGGPRRGRRHGTRDPMDVILEDRPSQESQDRLAAYEDDSTYGRRQRPPAHRRFRLATSS